MENQLQDISSKSLGLLLRPPIGVPILGPAIFQHSSLIHDIEHCYDSKEPVSPVQALNILVKFFHAYIHIDSWNKKASLKEISNTFECFVHRRKGSRILWRKDDLRRTLLKYGFALAMLADLPKSSAIFMDIANRRINPQDFDSHFLGIDIGAGTGILMLAQAICARKNNFRHIEITGIERDLNAFERTSILSRKTSIGNLITGDARKKDTFKVFDERHAVFISNETLPGTSARLWKEDFIAINRVLFDHYSHLLEKTHFFPQSVTAASKTKDLKIELSPANAFHRVEAHPLHLMYPESILINGRHCPLEHIGQELHAMIPSPWPNILAHRW